MSLLTRVSPNYFSKNSTKRIMIELTIGLMVVFLSTTIWLATSAGSEYAIHAVLMLVSALASAFVVETLWAVFTKQNIKQFLMSSFGWVTAIIIVLMCQVNTSYFAVIFGTVFALVFGKLVFGGFGHNIFNPAAVGRALILTTLAGSVVSDLATSATPLATISGQSWMITSLDSLSSIGGLNGLLFGFHGGALGEANALVLIAVCIYLIIRDVIDWRVPVFYVGTVALISAGVAIFSGLTQAYVLVTVFSGGLLFGAIFMATDPVTNPTSASGRVLFAIGCGILTMVIRLFASLPEGVMFSILIMNALSSLIESFTDYYVIGKHKRNLITVISLLVVSTLAIGAGSLTLAKTTTEPDPEPTPNSDQLIILDEEGSATLSTDESSISGDIATYIVRADGYGTINHGNKPNKFTVVIDLAKKEILSVTVDVFNDTEGVGDAISQDKFLSQYVGLSIEDDAIGIDAASGATVSSRSANAAVKAAINAAREEFGLSSGGNGSTSGTVIQSVSGNAVLDETATIKDGNKVTYVVRSDGYGTENHGDKPNRFDITIDLDKKEIVSVVVFAFNDTEGIGDAITQTSFLDQFVGMSIEDDQVSAEASSGATKSSNSAFAAVKAAILAARAE